MSNQTEGMDQAERNQQTDPIVTQRDLYGQLGVVWMFIAFSFMHSGEVTQKFATFLFFAVSLLMMVVYFYQSRTKKRG